MRETEAESEERVQVMKEDFAHYLTLDFDGEPIEDSQVLVVQEICRKITTLKDKGDRQELETYLCELGRAEIIQRADLNRGVAWFLCTAAIHRLVEDMPFVYDRLVEVVVELMDYSMVVKVLQTACKGIKIWFESLPDEERMVDGVEEMYDELSEKVYKKYMSLATMDEERVPEKLLTLINSMNHKANWPATLDDDKKFFQVMVEELISYEWVTMDQVAEFYRKMKEEGKSRNSMFIFVSPPPLSTTHHTTTPPPCNRGLGWCLG